ncbi:GmrSD restriction endonuclease domain-containing protein [Mameliella sp.]|uniref:GmrSD restriction endonuclease domain-containing protein n=1 Tax=Mameliella sp. TaxID=1924940 RepID=UPI003BA8D66E
MAVAQQELTVRGEQVERVFINFRDNKYIVNRKYQRKLIWTIEEKQKFIDSIIQGYPIPIILLAEPLGRQDGSLEIIDGMQRMNAITSFIANEFSVDGGYFDLNTFATTKDLLDRGVIEQKTPILERVRCLAIASYPVPLSIYEAAHQDAVEEVFRRINSGGRQLSRQELRAAGATNAFADCVRKISARVRGDTSNSDLLQLSEMRKISITNKDLEYGISADNVFWVSNGILSKDQLRQSRDEEMVADLVAYMISEEPVASRTELFDDYYGATFPMTAASKGRFDTIDQAIRKRSPELVDLDYQRVQDALVLILSQAKKTFLGLIFPNGHGGNPVPRYFQAVFLAFHNLIVERGMQVSDSAGLIARLTDSGKDIPNQDGGKWGAENRRNSVDSVVGWIQGYFEDDKNPDPAKVHWVTKFQNLLTNSLTEQAAYDFKQGFFTLSDNPSFDENSFNKIMETCAAIANIGKGHKGYVLVGVAENAETAARVQEVFGSKPHSYGGFHVTGVQHEAECAGKNLDQMFQDITDRIGRSALSEPLKSYVNSYLKCVQYYDKTVFVFEILGQDAPSHWNGKWPERQGAQVKEVSADRMGALFERFK